MKTVIIFSTITGNAFKLACAAKEGAEEAYGPYNLRYADDERVINTFDTFIICYWCNHGTADDDTLAFIEKLSGKNIIMVGSLGVSTDTPHAKSVFERVAAAASENNKLLGNYLCQGSIDLKRTIERTKIPEGEKGHLSMERFERQKLSLGHPNEEELALATEAVKNAVKSVKEQ